MEIIEKATMVGIGAGMGLAIALARLGPSYVHGGESGFFTPVIEERDMLTYFGTHTLAGALAGALLTFR